MIFLARQNDLYYTVMMEFKFTRKSSSKKHKNDVEEHF